MIPVEITFDDYTIRCVEKNDIKNILSCINESCKTLKEINVKNLFTYKDIEDRYIETLLNSLEFFCVIEEKNNFVGLIKGHIENKENINSIWIMSLIIFEKYDKEGIRSKIIDNVENYFMNNFSINQFYILKEVKSSQVKNYNGYLEYRMVRILDNNKHNNTSMLILEKKRDKVT